MQSLPCWIARLTVDIGPDILCHVLAVSEPMAQERAADEHPEEVIHDITIFPCLIHN